MTYILWTVVFVLTVVLISALIQVRSLKALIREKDQALASSKQETEQTRAHCDAETRRVQTETAAAIELAERALNEKLEKVTEEANQSRREYEARIHSFSIERERALNDAQKLLDDRLKALGREAERIREHYDSQIITTELKACNFW